MGVVNEASPTIEANAAAVAAAQLITQTKPSIGVQGAADALHRSNAAHPDGTGLDNGVGQHITITYGYLALSNELDNGIGNVTSSFTVFNAEQMAAFDKATAVWNDYANVTFVRVNPTGYVVDGLGPDEVLPDNAVLGGGNVNLFVGGYSVGVAGAAGYERSPPEHQTIDEFQANIWMNLSKPVFAGKGLAYGGYGFETFLHEMGHFLGLLHPGDYNADDDVAPNYTDSATFQEDNGAVTIMSYFPETFGGADYNGTSISTPLIADITAVHNLYGGLYDIATARIYSETYGFNGTYAPLTLTLPTDQIVGAIFDGGYSTLDFSLYTQAANLDLSATYQSVGGLINNLQIVSAQVVAVKTGSGDDTIVGGQWRKSIEAGAGDDYVDSGDILYMSTPDGIFTDSIYGGAGDDTLLARNGDDKLYGEAGDDSLDGGHGANLLVGGEGNDTLQGQAYGSLSPHPVGTPARFDTLQGGNGDDVLIDGDDGVATYGNLLMQGDAGNDLIFYIGGHDTIEGGTGQDTLSFERMHVAPGAPGIQLSLANPASNAGFDAHLEFTGIEAFVGTNSDDTLIAGDAAVTLKGAQGDDILMGGLSHDALFGNEGNDTLLGSLGADSLYGGDGNDRLNGGGGTEGDTLIGGFGDDTIMAPAAGLAAAEFDEPGSLGTAGDLLDLADIPGADPLVTHMDVYLGTHTLLLFGEGFQRKVDVIGFRHVSGSSLAETYLVDLGKGPQTIEAMGGDDRVVAFGAGSVLDGGDGQDRVEIILTANDLAAVLDLAAGTLTVNGAADSVTNFEDGLLAAGSLTLSGTEGANVLVAKGLQTLGTMLVYGLAGDDDIRLTGRGQAVVDAGAGNDSVRGFFISEVNSSQSLSGGTGEDLLDFSDDPSATTLTVDLALNQATVGTKASPGRVLAQINGFESATGLQAGGSKNFLSGTAGANTLTGGAGADWIEGDDGADTLIGHGGKDSLTGGGGDDLVNLSGALPAGSLAHGNEGVDILSLTGIVDAGGSAFTFTGTGNFAGLAYDGFERVEFALNSNFASNATLTGGALNDTLEGALGNDTLIGGAGDDVLKGHEGDDRFTIGADAGNDSVDGGEGFDTLIIGLTDQPGGVILDLSGPGFGGGGPVTGPTPQLTSIEATLIQMGSGDDSVVGSAASDTILGGAGNDTLNGASGGDSLEGGTGDDLLTDQVAGGSDTMRGGEGNDTLVSGTGADLLDGGSGNDLLQNFAFFYAGFTDPATERDTMQGGAGDDTIQSFTPGAFEGGDGTDRLIYALGNAATGVTLNLTSPSLLVALPNGATVRGVELFDLTLTNQNDKLTVNYGAHHLAGGYGVDVLTIMVAAGQSFAAPVITKDLFAPPGEGETQTFANGMTVTGFVTVVYASKANTPTEGDDQLFGTTGANNILALGGNDTVYAQAGHDTLDGGTGADSLIGGTGNDTYIVDDVGDAVVENANEGVDTVRTTLLSYALPDDVEKLVYTGAGAFTGMGNALANTLTGSIGKDTLTGLGGNDTLDGGANADSLVGGQGDDTYLVDNIGDEVVEAASGGQDKVLTTLDTYTLSAEIEALTYVGAGGFAGTGNALSNVMTGGAGSDFLSGLDGTDTLRGGAGEDALYGGSGNDTLDGGLGADKMLGGLDDDLYLVDDAGDQVEEMAFDQGVDTVRTILTDYTLTIYVDRLVYSGAGNFTGTGNALSNAIYGNNGNDNLYGMDGDDALSGEAGADHLFGGLGNDTYEVENAGDVVVENANEGKDTVRVKLASYTLTADVEKLIYAGSGDFTGTGNLLANYITGGAGNDKLYGGSGNDTLDGGQGGDTLEGGAGDDLFLVINADDVVVENPGEGMDSVRTGLNQYMLTANVEKLAFVGFGKFAGTGNDGDNSITGGNSDDMLDGGAGNDTLDGGAGVDLLTGGAGNDSYLVANIGDQVVELANEGLDKITASISFTLSENIESLVLTGNSGLTGTGNGLANTLTGNAGDNLLSGGGGADTLSGGAGQDTLLGGAGADRLTGGANADVFRYADVGEAGDVITDFAHGQDMLEFSAGGFGGDLAIGMDLTERFVAGSAANKAMGQFLYNPVSRTLSWDIDGTGAEAKQLIAIFWGLPALDVSDLHIIA